MKNEVRIRNNNVFGIFRILEKYLGFKTLKMN